jgi:hypothetical protein
MRDDPLGDRADSVNQKSRNAAPASIQLSKNVVTFGIGTTTQ